MQPVAELTRDLVLVGGGHSHAIALRRLAMRPLAGVRITLISPSSHTPYSGMLPGLVAGHYTFEETHIDLAKLCQWAGARFVCAQVTALDPHNQCVSVQGRPAIHYDVISLDTGSEPELDSVPGARTHATPVKPVARLWQRWQAFEARMAALHERPARIGIVGGGAGSVELALAMAYRVQTQSSPSQQRRSAQGGPPASSVGAPSTGLQQARHTVQVELWCGAEDILQAYDMRARRAVKRALHEAGIVLHTQARVVDVQADRLTTAAGRQGEFDELFWCTGAAPAPWVAASGLATDAAGFLAVNEMLQSHDDPAVFAAGDIAAFTADPRPKAGVYAVRQAPVLEHNLRALLEGRTLRRYRPQRRFLSLLSLGEKRATAERGRFSATGAWVWQWKDRIDRNFMARFSALPTMSVPATSAAVAQQPCGGCGAKVGAQALAAVLAELATLYPEHCSAAVNDASPVPVAPGQRIVQSVDVLRQIVADPWLMGRIAANHALSDLYACGARPVSALAAVTLPFASARVLQRDLFQILAGAMATFAAADCRLNGGHSMQGPELQLGFTVNGVAMDCSDDTPGLLGKTGAAAGDALVLTKPLGTGALFAAHMLQAADGRDIQAAIAMMLASNARAAQLALSHRATACTDITGFGLLGHLLEMLGDDQGAQLEASAVPLLPGAMSVVQAGMASTMAPSNVASFGARLRSSANAVRAQLLFDPQTSGGLLIAVPGAQAAELCTALRHSGYTSAAVIGRVCACDNPAGVRVELR